MNIKARLSLTFLAVSLTSLTVSNSLSYYIERDHSTGLVLSHLESVASIQRTRIQGLYQQNLERLGLVASRTQLRISLDKFNRTGAVQHQNKMNRIIADARKTIDDFQAILILALDGNVVAATENSRIGESFASSSAFESGKRVDRVDFFELDENQNLRLRFTGPLYLNDVLIGVLVIESAVDTMMSSIVDYTGLGSTGETMLASRAANGDAVFIMPTRFDKDAALKLRIKSTQVSAPMIHAVNGGEMLFKDSVDYRGEQVLSVTRYIEGAKWGLEVKIDKREAFSHLATARDAVLAILIIGSTLVVLITIYISRQITQPIIRLTETAKKIIDGDLTVRADESHGDETGLLGRTFNLMTASLVSEQEKLQRSKAHLQSSEAKFRGVLESAVDGVLMVDGVGEITLANQALCEMTGYTNQELVGASIEKLVPASITGHKHERDHFYSNPITRRMGADKSLNAQHKDGSLFPVEISLTPVTTSHGKEVAAIVQDITVRRQVEHEKETLLKSLEEKNEELERFTYTVSHDLKSPLVTISGFIGLLEDDLADGNKQRVAADIARISEAAVTMRELLDDLLELSRIGRQGSARVELCVKDVVQTALEWLAPKIEETNATVMVEDGLPTIFAEEARFKEVFLNLIENAIKYRRHDAAPEITVGARRNLGHGSVIFVKDNGIGIEARFQEKIFGLFERLEQDNEGTGVGLAIVKRIIGLHEGRIWVESDGLGCGSTFCFVIPESESNDDRGV